MAASSRTKMIDNLNAQQKYHYGQEQAGPSGRFFASQPKAAPIGSAFRWLVGVRANQPASAGSDGSGV